MKRNIIGVVTAAIIVFLISLIALPVVSFKFNSLAILLIVFAVIVLIFNYSSQGKVASDKSNYNTSQKNIKPNLFAGVFGKIGGVVLIVAISYLIIMVISSSAMFNAKGKQEMLNVEEVIFDESVPNVDMDNLIIWDETDAIRFGEKLITEKDSSLGSMYSISKQYGTLSVINGKPHWLFPLEHSGFFKYMKNKTIPGYIKVNATTGDAEFIEEEFSVAPSAYFDDDLKRVVYTKYKTVGLTDYSFEEDSKGNPKWVITAYTHATGIYTSKVLGVIIVDPITKDVEYYSKDSQPEWVDRVSSIDIFEEHLTYWGKYINGWLNPSNEGKLKNTDGIGYVFKEGNIYFYTGITSYGGDEATTGFLIYNPRTLVAQYNRLSGSTEQRAMGLMQELVQNAGYTAKYPYLVNINGEATYLSTLKGNSGNVVGYALSSVKNYRAVAWGTTLREAQTEYNRILISESGSSNSLSDQFDSLQKSEGVVSRTGIFKDGYYVIKLENNNIIFVISIDQFPHAALTHIGDLVEISYLKTDESEKIDAINFINNTIE